jgi:hypothetical protein
LHIADQGRAGISAAFRTGSFKLTQYAAIVLWFSLLNIASVFVANTVHNVWTMAGSTANSMFILIMYSVLQCIQAVLNIFLIPMLVDKQYTIVHLFQRSFRYVMTYWWSILKLVVLYIVLFLCLFMLNILLFSLIKLFFMPNINPGLIMVSSGGATLFISYYIGSIFVAITRVLFYRKVSESP